MVLVSAEMASGTAPSDPSRQQVRMTCRPRVLHTPPTWCTLLGSDDAVLFRGDDEPMIFLSYTHTDIDHIREFVIWLNRVFPTHEVWWDENIRAGEAWDEVISKYADQCDLAIAAVSWNFLNSDFIMGTELPKLHHAGRPIFPFPLSTFPVSNLRDFLDGHGSEGAAILKDRQWLLDFAVPGNAMPSVITGSHHAREEYYQWCRKIHGRIASALEVRPVIDGAVVGLIARGDGTNEQTTPTTILNNVFTAACGPNPENLTLSARGDIAFWREGAYGRFAREGAAQAMAQFVEPLPALTIQSFAGGCVVSVSPPTGGIHEFILHPDGRIDDRGILNGGPPEQLTHLGIIDPTRRIGVTASGALFSSDHQFPPGWQTDHRWLGLDVSNDGSTTYVAAISARSASSEDDDPNIDGLELWLAVRDDAGWFESSVATVYPESQLRSPLTVHVERRLLHGRRPTLAIAEPTRSIRLLWDQPLAHRRNLLT